MAKKKVSKPREHTDFKEYLLERLKDPGFAIGYLNESLIDEDTSVFLLALKDVFMAQIGDMSVIAQHANMSRPKLSRILSRKGDARMTSVQLLLHLINLEFTIRQRPEKPSKISGTKKVAQK